MSSSPRSSPTPLRTSSRRCPGNGNAPLAPDPARPLESAEFAALIEALGPFERRPRLAVAVSGGPDSLCLCLLADGWARARGGEAIGLIVDHGLRPNSTEEASQVAAWLGACRIDHRVLRWTGAKPKTGVQAAAREARYRLLGDWCRAAGVLHLLLAHHLDDQAETVALREARQSGADGLAGMAAVRELSGVRLLRPLLSIPKARLQAALEALGQPWIVDPSNMAAEFARSRLRRGPGLEVPRLARLAVERGRERAERDRRAASWLARSAQIDPAGFVRLAGGALAEAPPEIARRAVQQILMSIGGRDYPPRGARLDHLVRRLLAGPVRGCTLAGCRVLPWRGMLLVCREPPLLRDEMALAPGAPVLWDGRFRIELHGAAPALAVRALGRAGTRALGQAARTLPAPVRPSLPALWQGEELLAVPHLGLILPWLARCATVRVRFNPGSPLAGAPFRADGADRNDTVASARRAHMLGFAARCRSRLGGQHGWR
jgi:tRNA(Ile)-lysidine synthase